MKTRTIVEYVLAALIVLMLGGLSGWYFFLRTQSEATVAKDAARGYGTASPLGDAGIATPQTPEATPAKPAAGGQGFLSRIWSALTGRPADSAIPSSGGSFGAGFGGLTDAGGATQEGAPDTAPEKPRPPQLWHVEENPVAGSAFARAAGTPLLRYVERSSGYVFQADPETGTIIRLTNTLMPKIYEALISQNGHVYERSLEDDVITTFAGSLPATSTATDAVAAQSLSGVALVHNIVGLASNPKTDEIVYLVPDGAGAAIIRAQWNGEKPKRIFTSAIPHWRILWLEDGRIILTQAAADSVAGYSYELKSDGTLTPLLRDIPGLTMLLKPSSGALIYGRSEGGVLALFAQVSASATPVEFSIKTVADKCVWSAGKNLIAYCGVPQGILPDNFLDNWYRGVAHSSDALWRVDVSAGSAELVYAPDVGMPIDIVEPSIDSNGKYISFMNALDRSLWILRLEK